MRQPSKESEGVQRGDRETGVRQRGPLRDSGDDREGEDERGRGRERERTRERERRRVDQGCGSIGVTSTP